MVWLKMPDWHDSRATLFHQRNNYRAALFSLQNSIPNELCFSEQASLIRFSNREAKMFHGTEKQKMAFSIFKCIFYITEIFFN